MHTKQFVRKVGLSVTLIRYKRLIYPIVSIILMMSLGTLGYALIEGWSLFDSFYMTVITVGTVGFGETHPLSNPGRLFTIALIISSFSLLGYSLSVVMSFIVEGELSIILKRRRMRKEISKLSNHYVICGYGNTGKYVVDEFIKTNTPLVLIEKNPETDDELSIQNESVIFLHGDATHDSTLLEANIANARGLVSALSSDKDNLFVVLTARALNPSITIVSRVIEKESEKKLITAGANYVVSPNIIGGMRMASIMLRPTVVNFLDQMLKDDKEILRLEEVEIMENSPLLDLTLAESQIPQKTGLIVVAMRVGKEKRYMYNPQSSTRLNRGDILIVLGSVDQVSKLRQIVVRQL